MPLSMWTFRTKLPFLIAIALCESFAIAGPLTLRNADRAIDLAHQAELAGDYAGARSSLEAIVKSSTSAVETPGRRLLESWLSHASEREAAFRAHGKTPLGFHRAFVALGEFGPTRSREAWDAAEKALPDLSKIRQSAVTLDLRFEEMRGPITEEPIRAHVEGELARQGLVVRSKGARYEVRINVDAEKSAQRGRDVQVTAEVSMMVRDLARGGEVIAIVAKRRTESRRDERHAREFALRLVLDEANAALVYRVRSEILAFATRETTGERRD